MEKRSQWSRSSPFLRDRMTWTYLVITNETAAPIAPGVSSVVRIGVMERNIPICLLLSDACSAVAICTHDRSQGGF
jgi:hypothetical protein